MADFDVVAQIYSTTHTPNKSTLYALHNVSNSEIGDGTIVKEGADVSHVNPITSLSPLAHLDDTATIESEATSPRVEEFEQTRFNNLATPRSCAIFNDRFNSLLVPVARDREVEMSEPALDPVRTPDHDSHSKPSRWASTESAELSVDSSGYYASDSSCSAASFSTSKRTPVVIYANRSENTTHTPTSEIAKTH